MTTGDEDLTWRSLVCEGEFTTSFSNLSHCCSALIVKNFFLISIQNLLFCSLYPFDLVIIHDIPIIFWYAASPVGGEGKKHPPACRYYTVVQWSNIQRWREDAGVAASAMGTGSGKVQQRGKNHVLFAPPRPSLGLECSLMELFRSHGGMAGWCMGGRAAALGVLPRPPGTLRVRNGSDNIAYIQSVHRLMRARQHHDCTTQKHLKSWCL